MDSMWHNLPISAPFSQVETLLQRQVSKIRGLHGNEQRKCGPDASLGVAALRSSFLMQSNNAISRETVIPPPQLRATPLLLAVSLRDVFAVPALRFYTPKDAWHQLWVSGALYRVPVTLSVEGGIRKGRLSPLKAGDCYCELFAPHGGQVQGFQIPQRSELLQHTAPALILLGTHGRVRDLRGSF